MADEVEPNPPPDHFLNHQFHFMPYVPLELMRNSFDEYVIPLVALRWGDLPIEIVFNKRVD
jgi:hypothetical protein